MLRLNKQHLCVLLLLVIVSTHAYGQYGQFAPEDAYLEGTDLPYYGSENEWDRRFFERHIHKESTKSGRRGQRQMLDIVEQKPREAITYCQDVLQEQPTDLESLFNLTVAWCAVGKIDHAFQTMKQAVDAGLPFERFLAGPRDLLLPLTASKAFRQYAAGRSSGLIHGPMLGCLTDQSAKFWVRTLNELPVEVLASPAEDLGKAVKSTSVRSRADRDYTAIVELAGLDPDTRYHYDVLIDGKSTLAPNEPSFRTFPKGGAGASFQIGFGGGAGYVPQNERMWNTIASHHLAAFLFLGDNVYIDLPQEACAFHDYTYYRRQSRPEYRRLIARTPIYAIWDDHDCAIDDVFMGPHVDQPSWKLSLWRQFRNNWNNPAYGDGEQQPGCWCKFAIADVDFIMLDGRFYRTNPHWQDASMLGPRQKAWLLDVIGKSQATFKVLASPVPWAFDSKAGSLDTWNGYRAERNEIFDFLKRNKIEGVILISADRHRSDARRIDHVDAYPLYEFESSKLTNLHSHEQVGSTLFSYNQQCSFGKLSFDTTKADPEVTFQIVSIDNEPIHTLTLKKSALSHR